MPGSGAINSHQQASKEGFARLGEIFIMVIMILNCLCSLRMYLHTVSTIMYKLKHSSSSSSSSNLIFSISFILSTLEEAKT